MLLLDGLVALKSTMLEPLLHIRPWKTWNAHPLAEVQSNQARRISNPTYWKTYLSKWQQNKVHLPGQKNPCVGTNFVSTYWKHTRRTWTAARRSTCRGSSCRTHRAKETTNWKCNILTTARESSASCLALTHTSRWWRWARRSWGIRMDAAIRNIARGWRLVSRRGTATGLTPCTRLRVQTTEVCGHIAIRLFQMRIIKTACLTPVMAAIRTGWGSETPRCQPEQKHSQSYQVHVEHQRKTRLWNCWWDRSNIKQSCLMSAKTRSRRQAPEPSTSHHNWVEYRSQESSAPTETPHPLASSHPSLVQTIRSKLLRKSKYCRKGAWTQTKVRCPLKQTAWAARQRMRRN